MAVKIEESKKKNASFFRRLGAYLLDYFIVYLVVTCLSGITFINPKYNEYSEIYNSYMTETEEVTNFLLDFETKYQDKKIEEDEYKDLIKKNDSFEELINKYYDNGINEENHDKLTKELMDKFTKNTESYSYKLEKNNIITEIILIVVTFLYFVLFTYYVDGISLGKKMFKLQVVNKDNKKVKISELFIRTIILSGVIFNSINIISICLCNQKMFYNVSLVSSAVRIVVELMIMLFIAYRKDGRGLHDIIAKTKVISTKED